MTTSFRSRTGWFARGVRISYEEAGQGAPIILVHGFASNRASNWIAPGWFKTLTEAGRRVVALDCRGHGDSEKLYAPADYDEGAMAGDIVRLMDHLAIPHADVMGYSMGGFLVVRLLADAPARVGRAIVSGVGQNYFTPLTVDAERVAAALLAPSADAVTDPVAKGYRAFAERQKGDLKALAACMRRPRVSLMPGELARLRTPVLVACGERDDVSGRPEPLARAFADGTSYVIPGRDHMLAVGDAKHKKAVLQFLAGQPV